MKTNGRYLVVSRNLVVSKALPDLLSSRRLMDADYLNISYAEILNGVYNYVYDPSDNGLVIHNGGLIYPANSGLSDRNYYGLFKYNNPNAATLASLSFSIDHSGSETDWLTDANTGGTVDLNKIKFEFLIKREAGTEYGWYNPFAVYNTPYGVAETSISRSGIVTNVSCTLSITPRVHFNDLVIVKVIASPEWTNKIRNIKIVGFE